METPKGRPVQVDSLGHLGYLFKCEGEILILKHEQESYLLYKDDSKKDVKNFNSWQKAQQAILKIFDQLLEPRKKAKKKAKKKAIK